MNHLHATRPSSLARSNDSLFLFLVSLFFAFLFSHTAVYAPLRYCVWPPTPTRHQFLPLFSRLFQRLAVVRILHISIQSLNPAGIFRAPLPFLARFFACSLKPPPLGSFLTPSFFLHPFSPWQPRLNSLSTRLHECITIRD